MAPIHYRPVDHPSAWTPATVRGKHGLQLALTTAQLDAIDTLLSSSLEQAA